MARKEIITYKVVSDLSEEEFETNEEPLRFGWDGVWYEIDLTSKEQEELENFMAKYLDVAREVQPYKATATSGEQAKMRAWLRENQDRLVAEDKWPKDITLGDRGQIHGSLKEIFKNETKS